VLGTKVASQRCLCHPVNALDWRSPVILGIVLGLSPKSANGVVRSYVLSMCPQLLGLVVTVLYVLCLSCMVVQVKV
jgi:hypothetical protein